MSQQSRRLQDLRHEIEGVWQDSAARDLNARYLQPHQNDDSQMLISYRQQSASLEQAEDNILAAHEHGNTAGQLTLQIEEMLQVSDEELRNAQRCLEMYSGHQSDARAQLPLVQKFIGRANNACS
jgi:hypothetical protein